MNHAGFLGSFGSSPLQRRVAGVRSATRRTDAPEKPSLCFAAIFWVRFVVGVAWLVGSRGFGRARGQFARAIWRCGRWVYPIGALGFGRARLKSFVRIPILPGLGSFVRGGEFVCAACAGVARGFVLPLSARGALGSLVPEQEIVRAESVRVAEPAPRTGRVGRA
ncbi:MAG TPA: hypothetical protein VFY87_03795, partial [Geminicoccaceae bacterium]|nr:hypothetical protein [Geminicoccaceae bacterium]